MKQPRGSEFNGVGISESKPRVAILTPHTGNVSIEWADRVYGPLKFVPSPHFDKVVFMARGVPWDVCIPKGYDVITKNGLKDISDITIGEQVLSHDGRFHRAIGANKRFYEGNTYKIKIAKLSFPIEFTGDHPILAVKRSENGSKHKWGRHSRKELLERANYRWCRADELEVRDYVLVPIPKETCDAKEFNFRRYIDIPLAEREGNLYILSKTVKNEVYRVSGSNPIPKTLPLNEDFLSICGFYIAEGSCSGRVGKKNALQISFGKTEKEVKLVHECIARLKRLGLPTQFREGDHSIAIYVNSRILAQLFTNIFGRGAENKTIPHDLFVLPLEKQKWLLRGILLGDAWISKKTVEFVTVSKTLAYQVFFLFMRQGIVPLFTVKKPHRHNKLKSYHIRVYEPEHLMKLGEILGVNFEVKRKKRWSMYYVKDGFLYLPITNTEKREFKGWVYNIAVEESNTFLCELVTVHNCRNMLVKQALGDPQVTHLMWIDSDVVFEQPSDPNEAILQLMQCNAEIVSGIYRARQKSGFNYSMWLKHPQGFVPVQSWSGNWISVDVIGMGCCLMKREVFERVPEPWFWWGPGESPSEDFNFCLKAKEHGFKVMVYTDVRASHISGGLKVLSNGSVTTLDV